MNAEKKALMLEGMKKEVENMCVNYSRRVRKMQEVIDAALIHKPRLWFKISEQQKRQILECFTQVIHAWYNNKQDKLGHVFGNNIDGDDIKLKDEIFKRTRTHWNHIKAVKLGNRLFSTIFAELFIYLASPQSIEPDIFLYIDVCCDLLRATAHFDQTKPMPLVLNASLVKANKYRDFCKEFVECLSCHQIVFELAPTSKSVAKSSTKKATSKYVRDPQRAANQKQRFLLWLQQLSEVLRCLSDEERQERIHMFTRWCISNQMAQLSPRLLDNDATNRPPRPLPLRRFVSDTTATNTTGCSPASTSSLAITANANASIDVAAATSVEPMLPSIVPLMSSTQHTHRHYHNHNGNSHNQASDVALTTTARHSHVHSLPPTGRHSLSFPMAPCMSFSPPATPLFCPCRCPYHYSGSVPHLPPLPPLPPYVLSRNVPSMAPSFPMTNHASSASAHRTVPFFSDHGTVDDISSQFDNMYPSWLQMPSTPFPMAAAHQYDSPVPVITGSNVMHGNDLMADNDSNIFPAAPLYAASESVSPRLFGPGEESTPTSVVQSWTLPNDM
eukprot:CAMPEP_0202713310 /NCGR_PEP_ID=MMETSP1385-20130828/52493_1 /ASSEMBLY_ACC=CAM_ASM_000861 /TAXON_ID=933848 /ORGANISM="Elphidium margaritaceum" /LENGTH=557 /DNA_ID=CAMNT_0049373613 /DNA_START=46 /DNA_END=1719 /DNA_ORIENTATION=-